MVALLPLSLLLLALPDCGQTFGTGLNDAGVQELSRVLVILSPLLIILACAGLGKALSESYGTILPIPSFSGFPPWD